MWTWSLQIHYDFRPEQQDFWIDYFLFLAVWFSWVLIILKLWVFKFIKNSF